MGRSQREYPSGVSKYSHGERICGIYSEKAHSTVPCNSLLEIRITVFCVVHPILTSTSKCRNFDMRMKSMDGRYKCIVIHAILVNVSIYGICSGSYDIAFAYIVKYIWTEKY